MPGRFDTDFADNSSYRAVSRSMLEVGGPITFGLARGNVIIGQHVLHSAMIIRA